LLVTQRIFNVLFLCTGNSARSIIAESLLNAMGQGRFRAYSAGSHPSGEVNPLAVEFLAARGLPADEARSKSWDEYAASGAPRMDMVITVCDQAAGEVCPVWPGHPARAHWSAPDPAAYMDDPQKARQVIREVFALMQQRVSLLINLPLEWLDPSRIETEAKSIAAVTKSPPSGQH
jgi:arsenate reductase (thioredoxin)